MGVSDLEVWTVLSNRPNSYLWLQPHLHAKYYRVDNSCLIGSANLTATALGWKQPANLELLLSLKSDNSELRKFEAELFTNAILANEAIYLHMQEVVKLLPKEQINNSKDEGVYGLAELSLSNDLDLNKEWFPQLRHPEDLYKAYTKQLDRLSKESQIMALNDLQVFAVPLNLNKDVFNAYVGVLLLQQPCIQAIDQFVITPQRFGAVKNLLATRYKQFNDFDAGYTWQTLMRWLLHFLPNRYTLVVPHHSEIFSRKL